MDELDKELERLNGEIERLDKIKARINDVKKQEKIKEIEVQQTQSEPSLKDSIRELNSILKGEKKDKNVVKNLKLMRRAKVGKSRMKKGYCGVMFLHPNKVVKGEKILLDGGTYRTKDGNIHVTDGSELFFWEGKFPLLFQRYDKLNPTNLSANPGEKNEIYGQTMVELRMKKDLIKEKTKGKYGWLMIVAVLVGGYFLVKAFFPKLFGG